MDRAAFEGVDEAGVGGVVDSDGGWSAGDRTGHGRSGCPVDVSALVSGWAGSELMCRAGRREFKLNRYCIAAVRDGKGLRKELDAFLDLAAAHEKTGLFTLIGGAATRCTTVREELTMLAELVCDAGLVRTPEEALSGKEICLPVEMLCPVTGLPAAYSFFPVTFCRNASKPTDELYDVSLSCPWSAINTTSDAFAFALMVRDRSRRIHGCDPFQIGVPELVQELLSWSVMAWQNMSIATIRAFGKKSVRPDRAVDIAPGGRYWTAAHQDPVFAELSKEAYAHEMPLLYGNALAEKWFSALFEGEPFEAGREGQAGGVRVPDNMNQGHELHQFSFA